LACFPELFDYSRLTSKILLATDEDDGQAGAKMHNLGNPLLLYVIEGVWGVNSEANKDDVGVGIAEGSETIIIFLAGGIP